MSAPSEQALPVGERIKRLREGACLSVEQLAQRIGLDAEELRRIEERLISPPLGVLVKVCDGLGVRLGHFFDHGPRKLFSLVRAADEKVATRFAAKDGTDFGIEYRALGSEKRERRMDPFLITFDATSEHPVELEGLSTHGGEEFLFVLEGEIEILLQDDRLVLGPGDSVYYDANMPHRVSHTGKGTSRVLAVISLPRGEKS
ncbi:MAG TPA: XRE family transcriptional regulator [Myxococcota bacterium]|nr:XRE family transcriptional regulator [Myxococcota bacterium]HRY94137.1 XRE family transcriptional regulator [Myxococcota bacterium]